MNRLLSVLLAMLAGGAAQAVTPPPQTPGSAMVNVQGGLSKPESDRALRAHHHKFHYKKDYTRDDTIFGEPTSASGGVEVLPGTTASVVPARAVPSAMARPAVNCAAPAAASATPATGQRAGDLAAVQPRPGDLVSGKPAPGSVTQSDCTPVQPVSKTPAAPTASRSKP